MQPLMEDNKIKQLFKEAILEALEEKRNLFQDLFLEALEDVALTRAIQEGQNSGTAEKQEVMNILKGNA
jgi:hypothetical protein